MGLDVTIKEYQPIYCPDCGERVTGAVVESVCSSGRAWYQFLTEIGYYAPYDERDEEHDWYAKDMVLAQEQIIALIGFAIDENVYDAHEICRIARSAIRNDLEIAINADW